MQAYKKFRLRGAWKLSVLHIVAGHTVRAQLSSGLTRSKLFSLRPVFEDPITGCLAVAGRDDHSPIVMFEFLLIFGCGHRGILPFEKLVSSASTPPSLHPTASETDSPRAAALPSRIESTLHPTSCAVYPATSVELLHLIGN